MTMQDDWWSAAPIVGQDRPAAQPRPVPRPQPRPQQAAPAPAAAPQAPESFAPLTLEDRVRAAMDQGYDVQTAMQKAQEDIAYEGQTDPGMAPASPVGDDWFSEAPVVGTPEMPALDGVADWASLSPEEQTALGRGDRVRLPNGEVVTLRGSPYQSEGARPGERVVDGLILREPNLMDQTGAFVSGAAEQYPFLDEAAMLPAMLARGQSFSEARDDYRDMQTALNQQEGGLRDAGGGVGFLGAMFLPAGGGFVGRGVDRADKVRRSALAAGLVGSAYGAGGAEGGLGERAQSGVNTGLLSAATGGILQAGVNRLAAPTAETAQRRLSRMGQELTMGQMAGGGAQRVEDALTSLPFAGDVIRSRQRDTLSSFDTLATNTALNPLAQALESSAGRQGVREADDIISGAYNRALEPVTVFNPAEETLAASLTAARSPERLTADVSASLNSTLDNIFSQAPGEIDGQTWKRIDSQLGAAVRSADAGSATRPEMTALRDRLQQARTAWRDALGRVSEDALAGVTAADAAEAQYRLVRKASSDVASAGRGGDASPATLNRAVIGNANDRRAARGESLLQDLTDDAMQVLPRTVPDSGTPLRSLVTGAGIGGGGAALGVDPAALTLAALLTGGVSAAYSKPAQQLANRLYRASDSGGSTRDVEGLAAALQRSPVGVSLLVPDAQNSTQERRRVRQ